MFLGYEETNKIKRVTLAMPVEWVAFLKRKAERNAISMSQLVRHALQDYFGELNG